MKNHQAFLFHFNRRTCEVIKSTIKATRSSGSSSSKCFQTSVMYRSAPSNPGADVIWWLSTEDGGRFVSVPFENGKETNRDTKCHYYDGKNNSGDLCKYVHF